MKIENIKSIQKDIHLNAVEKGFWEDEEKRSKGEMVMLIISELSECLEADRLGQRTRPEDRSRITKLLALEQGDDLDFYTAFAGLVKNSVEDEIADTIIRILDFTAGWKEPLFEREYRKESTGNFGHDLLRIVHYVLSAFHKDPAKDWGYCIAAIEKFCDWYRIDINSHIAWKMAYNKRRPHKHGKKY